MLDKPQIEPLYPCRWCGKEPYHECDNKGMRVEYFTHKIGCHNCKIYMESSGFASYLGTSAVSYWNKLMDNNVIPEHLQRKFAELMIDSNAELDKIMSDWKVYKGKKNIEGAHPEINGTK